MNTRIHVGLRRHGGKVIFVALSQFRTDQFFGFGDVLNLPTDCDDPFQVEATQVMNIAGNSEDKQLRDQRHF